MSAKRKTGTNLTESEAIKAARALVKQIGGGEAYATERWDRTGWEPRVQVAPGFYLGRTGATYSMFGLARYTEDCSAPTPVEAVKKFRERVDAVLSEADAILDELVGQGIKCT